MRATYMSEYGPESSQVTRITNDSVESRFILGTLLQLQQHLHSRVQLATVLVGFNTDKKRKGVIYFVCFEVKTFRTPTKSLIVWQI